jgi:hypothetical protein
VADGAVHGCVVEGVVGKSESGGEDANARRRCESENIGCARDVVSSTSMSDSDTLLALCLSDVGCANGTREAEGMKCKVVNNADERTRSEGGCVVHCES